MQSTQSIVFDPGMQLLNLMDEFEDTSTKQRNHRASELSNITNLAPIGVPFKQIVVLAQITRGNVDEIENKIVQEGYPKPNRASLTRRVEYALHWLKKFGPEEIKITLQDKMPTEAKDLSGEQKKALGYLAQNLKSGMSSKEIHELIYKAKTDCGIEPQILFEAIYVSLVAKKRGPRAGMFLASLDSKFVTQRFTEVSAS